MLRMTVAVCTIMPGLKLPVPRSAAPIATIANCSAIAGMNQVRYSLGLRAPSSGRRRACVAYATLERASRRRRKITPTSSRQHLRLVEDEQRLLVVLASRRVRHQRRRADAEHLRHREDDERQVAGDADRGDRFLAQAADPVEIDQEVERLEHHRDEHEAGGLEQMAGDRSGGEVLHGVSLSPGWRTLGE